MNLNDCRLVTHSIRNAIIATALFTVSTMVYAANNASVNHRLDRLEAQVKEILQVLSACKRMPDSHVGHVVPRESGRGSQHDDGDSVNEFTAVTSSMRHGGMLYYFISKSPITTPLPLTAARSKGVVGNVHRLSFNPSDYDIAGSGLFSTFRDPSEYRSTALLLTGVYLAKWNGVYRFVLYPKPARSSRDMTQSVTVMSVKLLVDGEDVIDFEHSASWASVGGNVELQKGLHRFRLWAVDSAAGYGASPTQSVLKLAVRRPGDIGEQPLKALYLSQ